MPGILIIGAGPTGLTLACELAVRRVPFRLVDASPGPFAGSRAKGLQQRSVEVMDRLGIAAGLVADSYVELPFRQYAPDGGFRDVPRAGLGARPDVPYPSPLLLPQWRTEAALRGRLEALGGRVEYGCTLTDVASDAAGVRATLEREGAVEQADADWLVGCDGGRSTVRRAAGLQFIGETHEDMRMLVGDMRVDGIDRAHWHMWRPPGMGFLAMAPLAGTESFQVQVAIGPNTPDATTVENFQRLVDRLTGRTDIRLSEPTWTSLWRANVRMVDRYRAGRLFVAGDAAHVHTPAGGQGMNTGIQDAFNLGWKLAAVQGGADPALLDTYEAERLPVARHVLGLSTRLAASVTSPTQDGLVARDEDTSQLNVRYRESPLSQELRAAPGRVRAGDRAPDAPALRDARGSTHRLFDLWRGPAATLLAFGDVPLSVLQPALVASSHDALQAVRIVPASAITATDAAVHDVVDTKGHAAAAYEPGERTLFVIRPDGLVGFASDEPQADALLAWLRLAGLAR